MIRNVLISTLLAIAVTGCGATMGGGGLIPAMNGAQGSAQDPADLTVNTSLSEIGITGDNVVWVPAQYRTAGGNAMYIKGNRVVVPGGHQDVLGYLPNEQGYLIAVRQNNVDGTTSDRGNYVIYYQITDKGEVTQRYGVVQGGDDIKVVVGTNGIYAEVLVSQHNQFNVPLFKYVGYSTEGELLSGPENVRVARPAPDGGWYAFKPTRTSFTTLYLDALRYTAAGEVSFVQELLMDSRETHDFPITSAIFVDQAPLTDSARTGHFLWLYREHSNMTRDFQDWRVFGYIGDVVVKEGFRNRGYNLGNVGQVVNTSRNSAIGKASRIVLLGDVENIVAGNQKPAERFGPQTWELFHLTEPDAYRNSEKVFTLMGGGLNTLRSIVGNNTAGVSADSRNDVFAVITPEATMVMLANEVAITDQGNQAYVIGIGGLSHEEARGFIRTYNIN